MLSHAHESSSISGSFKAAVLAKKALENSFSLGFLALGNVSFT